MPENVVSAAWPEALKNVYEIKTSDPVEGGPDGIDNKPHRDLEKRTDYLLVEIARVAGLVPGTDEYEKLVEYLASLDVGIVRSRVDYIRTLLSAMGLYTDSKFWFEYFLVPEAVADLFDQEVEEARAGSDCIDLMDTRDVLAGREYFICDSQHSETLVVLEVLDNERFRTVEPIVHTYGPDARLVRTKWQFKPTQGIAIPGTWYYSKEMQLGYSSDKTLIIRREDNVGSLTVYSRGSGQAWREIPWEWKRPVGVIDGLSFVDVEYPISGNEGLEIKILCSDSPVVIHWMAAVASRTNLRGIHNGPYQPLNVWPLDGAVDVQETPTLQGEIYRHPTGAAQKTLEVQISESSTFETLTHYAQNLPAGASYTVPAGILLTEKTYYFRLRYGDGEDSFSPWSDPTSFSTPAQFIYVNTPGIVAPVNGVTDVGDSLVLECTAYDGFGTEGTHTATHWQLRRSTEDWAEALFDVETEDLGQLTQIEIPKGVVYDGKTLHLVRCRHRNSEGLYSEWSAESGFRTKESFGSAYGVASTRIGDLRHIDKNGNLVTLSKADFDAHPVWGNIVDVVSDGQQMVKIPKFYLKRGIGPKGSDVEGKECWWVSDAQLPGFKLAAAFKLTDKIELDYILVGKYASCLTDGGTKIGSLPGQTYYMGPTLASARSLSHARGSGWHCWDIHELAAIQYLALIELTSFDMQGAISQGAETFTHTGLKTAATDVIYRGIHELWGCCAQVIDGIDVDSTRYLVVFSDDGHRTMINSGVRGTNGNYIASFASEGVAENLFLAKTEVANTSNAICPDAQLFEPGRNTPISAGGMKLTDGAKAGLYYLSTNHHHTYSTTRIAKR